MSLLLYDKKSNTDNSGAIAAHMGFYVYVIECKDHGHYYVGITRNVGRRLAQHESLKGSSRFVKEHSGLLRLVLSIDAGTKSKARLYESLLTKELIAKHGPQFVAGAGLISLKDRERYYQRLAGEGSRGGRPALTVIGTTPGIGGSK